MLFLLLLLIVGPGRADERAAYQRWAASQMVVAHPEPDYHFVADIHARLAPLVHDRSGVVEPFVAGLTVEKRPVWAFRVSDPTRPVQQKMFVFGGIHALEWVGVESAFLFLEDMIRNPPPGVEVIVIPILNMDRRLVVEADLLAGRRVYRRANANMVDLNRDFAVNRESRAIWRHILPRRYATSPGPLSQPESQLIDRLADQERFDVAVSMHCFGGYLYYPWSGLFERPPDREEFVEMGFVMKEAQDGRGYRVQQLSHWGFFFRALGSEIDHLYGKYGTKAFLIEMTRSGYTLNPKTWSDPFRAYNPEDPEKHRRMGVQALRALAWHISEP
ncbi:MAG: M14 family zinc carboxypeptidase [Myxococcota bacterium]